MQDNTITEIDLEQIIRSRAGSKAKYIPKWAVNALKRLIHQDFINEFLRRGHVGVDFCEECIRYLDANIKVRGLEHLSDDSRKYTFVSNHPLGAIDGVALGMILGRKFNGNVKYLPEPLIKYRQHGDNQVGTEKLSHKFKKLEQVRNLFIEVKLGVFSTYVENNSRFPEIMQELNKKALDYYRMIKNKKNFNFKGWHIYHELYKHETISYYMLNFIIMNLPFIGKGLFKIRYTILKILRKRD